LFKKKIPGGMYALQCPVCRVFRGATADRSFYYTLILGLTGKKCFSLAVSFAKSKGRYSKKI
jgi:hypothetical protein